VLSYLLSDDFLFRNAILGGLGVALLCSLLGVYLVLRRLVLVGVALPQASAAGVAGVFWLSGHGHAGDGETHLLALAGSLGATFSALALLVAAQRRSRRPAEWGVGALFAISSAATLLFVALNPVGDMEMASLLRGELLAIPDSDLRALGWVLAAVGLFFGLFRRELLLASFDPEFARTLGRDPTRSDLLLHALLGSGIALGVMTAGPLVVFGFLVLPPLAALQIAPGLVSAFALSAALALLSFLAGFGLSYRADLPAGPVCVGVAAGVWIALAGAMRLLARWRRAATLLVAVVALAAAPGCAERFALAEARERAPLPRGSLPASLAAQPIAVLPFANATGRELRMPQGLLPDAARAIGAGAAEPGPDLPELLAERAGLELARRGFALVPHERVRAAVARAPGSAEAALAAAARAGLAGPVLTGTLRRFTLTQTGLLLVRLELALVALPARETLWTGAAQRPVPVESSLTWHEILALAGPPIFAEAFGER